MGKHNHSFSRTAKTTAAVSFAPVDAGGQSDFPFFFSLSFFFFFFFCQDLAPLWGGVQGHHVTFEGFSGVAPFSSDKLAEEGGGVGGRWGTGAFSPFSFFFFFGQSMPGPSASVI